MQTICKKSAFRDEVAADLFIASLHKKTKVRARMPKRSYYCDKCGFWHITSKADRQQGRITYLESELKRVKAELELLRQATNKEDRISIKVDARVKEVSEQLSKRNAECSRLHKDISMLVSKLATQNQIKNVEQ